MFRVIVVRLSMLCHIQLEPHVVATCSIETRPLHLILEYLEHFVCTVCKERRALLYVSTVLSVQYRHNGNPTYIAFTDIMDIPGFSSTTKIRSLQHLFFFVPFASVGLFRVTCMLLSSHLTLIKNYTHNHQLPHHNCQQISCQLLG